MVTKKKTEESVEEIVVETTTPSIEEPVVETKPKKTTKKKKTEAPKTEEVIDVASKVTEEVKEEVVETPVEPVVEESTEVEEVIPEPIVEEVKEEPVVEEKTIETEKEEKKIKNQKAVAENGIKVMSTTDTNTSPFTVQVVGVNGVYTFDNASLDSKKGKVIPKGMRIGITEVKGNWGKLANGKWILLGSAIVKI